MQVPVPLQEMFGAAYKAEFDSSSEDEEATAIGRARKRRKERMDVTSPKSVLSDGSGDQNGKQDGAGTPHDAEDKKADDSADAMEQGLGAGGAVTSPASDQGTGRRRSRSRSPAYRRSRTSIGETPANGRAGRRGRGRRGVRASKEERAKRAEEFKARALKNAERAKKRKQRQGMEDKLKKHREHMRAVVKELVHKSQQGSAAGPSDQEASGRVTKQGSTASDEAIGQGLNLPEHMNTVVGWTTMPYPPFKAVGEDEVSLGINMKGEVVCGSGGGATVMLHPEGLQANDVVGCGYEHVDDFADPDEEVSMIEG